MRSMVVAAVLLSAMTAQASNCSQTQSVLEIANQIQAQKNEMVIACEIRQVVAAQTRHAQLTGCAQNSQVRLLGVENQQAVPNSRGSVSLQSKVSVVNSGLGQPADSYIVTGELLSDGNGDCVITSVKLAPLDTGLADPVEQPAPYKQHPIELNN